MLVHNLCLKPFGLQKQNNDRGITWLNAVKRDRAKQIKELDELINGTLRKEATAARDALLKTQAALDKRREKEAGKTAKSQADIEKTAKNSDTQTVLQERMAAAMEQQAEALKSMNPGMTP